MSLIPPFQIGVWNAWIFMLCSLIPVFFMPLVARGQKEEESFTTGFSKRHKSALLTLHLSYLLLLIYSIFLPLKLGTVWFYVGLPVFLLGLIPYAITSVNFTNTPTDKPVTTGMYRYSRHPMNLTPFPIFIGAGIASASWLFLLIAVVYIVMLPLFVEAEERFCLKKYGDAYRDYVSRTPRWLGVPKTGGERVD
jgi:protein-S-isoprenylcysteine O-methyltransferase Ste14